MPGVVTPRSKHHSCVLFGSPRTALGRLWRVLSRGLPQLLRAHCAAVGGPELRSKGRRPARKLTPSPTRQATATEPGEQTGLQIYFTEPTESSRGQNQNVGFKRTRGVKNELQALAQTAGEKDGHQLTWRGRRAAQIRARGSRAVSADVLTAEALGPWLRAKERAEGPLGSQQCVGGVQGCEPGGSPSGPHVDAKELSPGTWSSGGREKRKPQQWGLTGPECHRL